MSCDRAGARQLGDDRALDRARVRLRLRALRACRCSAPALALARSPRSRSPRTRDRSRRWRSSTTPSSLTVPGALEAGLGDVLFWGSLRVRPGGRGRGRVPGQPVAAGPRQGPRRGARDRDPRRPLAPSGRAVAAAGFVFGAGGAGRPGAPERPAPGPREGRGRAGRAEPRHTCRDDRDVRGLLLRHRPALRARAAGARGALRRVGARRRRGLRAAALLDQDGHRLRPHPRGRSGRARRGTDPHGRRRARRPPRRAARRQARRPPRRVLARPPRAQAGA